jgi:hypothetical protein
MLMEMIARSIPREPEFRIIGAIAECSDLTSTVRHHHADLLIVGQPSLVEADVTALLSSSYPYPARILTISETAQSAKLYELRPYRETFPDISVASLTAAIRAAARESKPTFQ